MVGRTAYGGASDGTGVLEVRIVILGDESEFLKRGTDVAD